MFIDMRQPLESVAMNGIPRELGRQVLRGLSPRLQWCVFGVALLLPGSSVILLVFWLWHCSRNGGQGELRWKRQQGDVPVSVPRRAL